jgi:nucleotide-binding universal stress UspA family protein
VSDQRTRVIVGVTGSLANLAAVHVAVDRARSTDRPLVAVLASSSPAARDADAARLLTAFVDGFGALPDGVDLRLRVEVGAPADVLVDAAWRPGDLLVIGSGRHGGLRRLTRPSVGAECRRRARQLIVVPRPAMLDELGQVEHIHDLRGLASL